MSYSPSVLAIGRGAVITGRSPLQSLSEPPCRVTLHPRHDLLVGVLGVVDTLCRIDTVRDGNGEVAAYGFDVLDRLVSTTTSDITVTHGYDEIGNRTTTTTTDPHGTTSWDYELFGQLIEETLPGPVTLTYDYYDAGNLTTFTGPGGTVTYTYDDINRIATATDPGSGAQTTTFDYSDDISGQDVKTTTYPDGTVQPNGATRPAGSTRSKPTTAAPP